MAGNAPVPGNGTAGHYTVHWWDGFNREHTAKDPLERQAAEAELKLQVKKGAIRGELRDAASVRILAYERTESGQVIESYPPRKRGG